jgi:putative hydrolases of HD superfamily
MSIYFKDLINKRRNNNCYLSRELKEGFHMFNNERLLKQIEFIIEIDKIKHIFRKNFLMDGSRNENDAEHSWHLAIMAILLSEHCNEKIQVSKVIKMVLVHDLVEIYAGDTYCYDDKANEDKCDREQQSAARLFSILPEDQGNELRSLWEEFEAKKTPEAKFACALDRLQPLIHNYLNKGNTWLENGIDSGRVLKRNEAAKEIAPSIWEYINSLIKDAEEKGYFPKK